MVKWSLQVKCLHSFKEKTYSEREVTAFKIVLSVPAHENTYQILSALLSVRSRMKSFTTRFQKASDSLGLKSVLPDTWEDSAGLSPALKGFLTSWCNVTNRLRGLNFEFSQPVSSSSKGAGRVVPSWLHNASRTISTKHFMWKESCPDITQSELRHKLFIIYVSHSWRPGQYVISLGGI